MENFRKIHHYTHDDLDGYVCSVVVRTYREMYDIHCDLLTTFGNYQEIEKDLERDLSDGTIDSDNDLVIISDMSWPQSNTDLTKKIKNLSHLIVADHHATGEWIMHDIPTEFITIYPNGVEKKIHHDTYVYDGKQCGALILDRMMKDLMFRLHRTPVSQDYSELVTDRLDEILTITNDWDLFYWVDKVPEEYRTNVQYIIKAENTVKLDNLLQYNQSEFLDKVTKYILSADYYISLESIFNSTGFIKYQDRLVNDLEVLSKTYHRFVIPSSDADFPDTNAILINCPAKFGHKSILAYVVNNLIAKCSISDYDCLAIWECDDSKLSLRYGRTGVDLSKVAAYSPLGGGGHPFAAGMKIDSDELNRIVNHTRRYSF